MSKILESWPDNAPIIACDVDMGQKYEQFDFDIRAYNQFLAEHDISEARRQRLTINFSPIKDKGEQYKCLGKYVPMVSLIQIDPLKLRQPVQIDGDNCSFVEKGIIIDGAADDSLNHVLKHETAHLIDDIGGNRKHEIVQRIVGRKVLKVADITTSGFLFLSASYASEILSERKHPRLSAVIGGVAVASLFSLGHKIKKSWGMKGRIQAYESSYEEKFANDFIEQHKDQKFISTSVLLSDKDVVFQS